jgi:hypothetical protein
VAFQCVGVQRDLRGSNTVLILSDQVPYMVSTFQQFGGESTQTAQGSMSNVGAGQIGTPENPLDVRQLGGELLGMAKSFGAMMGSAMGLSQQQAAAPAMEPPAPPPAAPQTPFDVGARTGLASRERIPQAPQSRPQGRERIPGSRN